MIKSDISSGLSFILIVFLILCVIVLVNGISDIQAQNENILVQNEDIKSEVEFLKRQLVLFQQQAAEDSKRQRIEQWITTIVGAIAGWWLGRKPPGQQTQSKFWSFIDESFTDALKQIHNSKKQAVIEPLKEQNKTNSMAINHSKSLNQELSQVAQPSPVILSTRVCPKCGCSMEILKATKGKYKNTLFLVCPNHQQCQQLFPCS